MTEQPLTFEDPQVAILQTRLAAELAAHNAALEERQSLQQALANKTQEIDRRFGKVIALQELLQEAGAPLAPGMVASPEAEAQAAAESNGTGSPEAAAEVTADAVPEVASKDEPPDEPQDDPQS